MYAGTNVRLDAKEEQLFNGDVKQLRTNDYIRWVCPDTLPYKI